MTISRLVLYSDSILGGSPNKATLVIIGMNLNPPDAFVHLYSVVDGEVVWMKQGTDPPLIWTQGGTAVHGNDVYITGGQMWENVKFM